MCIPHQKPQKQEECTTILKWWRKKNSQPRMPYPVKLCFRNDSGIKIVLDEERLKELITSRPILKEMLKEVFLDWKEDKPEGKLGTSRMNEEEQKPAAENHLGH